MPERRAEWVPLEVGRDDALCRLPCVIYWGGHNVACETTEEAEHLVERLRGSVGEPRYFINGTVYVKDGAAVTSRALLGKERERLSGSNGPESAT